MTCFQLRAALRDGDKTFDDRGGFAALELAILLPFVLVMIAVVAAFGRVERGRQLVDQAAQAAARAGSLATTPVAATSAARDAAVQALHDAGLSCADVTITVDTTDFRPGGAVTAHLACAAKLSDVAMAGVPGSVTLTADATSALSGYRTVSSR